MGYNIFLIAIQVVRVGGRKVLSNEQHPLYQRSRLYEHQEKHPYHEKEKCVGYTSHGYVTHNPESSSSIPYLNPVARQYPRRRMNKPIRFARFSSSLTRTWLS